MHRHNIKKICLALLVACSAATGALAAPKADSTAGKAEDPVFSVPVVENPISSQDIKDLQIVEDGKRWLVRDKALQQYGIYPNRTKKGQYWFRLPAAADGKMLWQDRNVSLTLPGAESKEGRNISISHVRRPLGISYVLEPDHMELLPAPRPERSALELRQQPLPEGEVMKKYGRDALGMVLLWDPVMDENAPVPPLRTKQPVVSPCAFRITKDGVLLRNPDFDTLLMEWKAKGYAVWPLVDNNFNPGQTHDILSRKELREQLIKELIGYGILYEFSGYNIDFENVNYSDKGLLTQFVREFSDAARTYGLKTSIDVTPLSDSPNWSLVYDRAALGQSVDYVMLMAYDQVGRTSPVAGPTATYPWVKTAIENTLKFVPADKVILGMPLYMRIWYEADDGKDLPKDIESWPVSVKASAQTGVAPAQAGAAPARTGTAKAKPKLFVRTLTMADSHRVREKYASSITWDADLRLYYLDTRLPKGRLRIWFEDEKSLKEKIGLIHTYQLAGASFWRKGFEPENFWHGFAKHELT